MVPAPPSGTNKCVLLGCLVHFFGKRADSENHRIFEHIFQKVTMRTHFFKWLGFVQFCAVFRLASPFPTCAQTYFPNQPWCARMWLDLTPSYFHNVFVERWPGHRWCDSHGATHLCQRFLYLALPQSTSKAACCARSWGHSCFHACMTVCMTLLSYVSIWLLLQDKHWNFPARYQMF